MPRKSEIPDFATSGFPPKWKHVCGVSANVWNREHPAVATVTPTAWQWSVDHRKKLADFPSFEKELFHSSAHVVAWIFRLLLGGSKDCGKDYKIDIQSSWKKSGRQHRALFPLGLQSNLYLSARDPKRSTLLGVSGWHVYEDQIALDKWAPDPGDGWTLMEVKESNNLTGNSGP